MTDATDQKQPPPVPGELLDVLEETSASITLVIDAMVEEMEGARTVPLSASVMVNKEEFIARLGVLRDELLAAVLRAQELLPEELRAARWMVRERERYIARTNERAREMLGKAKARSEELVSDSHVIKEAVEEANRLVRSSEKDAERIRLEAEDYAERQLTDIETFLGEMLQLVQEARAEFHETLPPPPDVPLSQ
jgi:cell division septum initiation protein DivIVA